MAESSESGPAAQPHGALIGKVAEAMTPGSGPPGEARFPLPTVGLIGACAMACGAALLLGALLGPRLRAGAGADAAYWGAAAAFAGTALGVLAVRPWRARSVGEWPFALLAGQGVSFLAVLFVAAALYSSTRPDAVVFAVVAGGGFLGAILAQAAVYGPLLRETGPSAR